MKFYCLFDLLDYYRKEKKQDLSELYLFFRKHKITKKTLDFYKTSCSLSSAKQLMPAVEEYTGLSELEIFLSLGIIPEAYRSSFFDNIHAISAILDNGKVNNRKAVSNIAPVFATELGSLYNDDCLNVLAGISNDSVDLIFADPPFNLSKVYDNGIKDNLGMTDYISWSYAWIDECVRILKPGGSLYIYNIPKWGSYYSEFLNRRLNLRSWIGVNMKFSLPLSGRLYPAHYSLLYYIKGEKPNAYNNQRIPIETCRHCGGEIRDYGGYKNKMNPQGVNLSDIWSDIYPVRHANTKNRAYNELSIKMLDRIISMSSNPGDLVFDPFGGSGTTYVVSELLNRRWIGSELGNCDIIKERFASIEKDRELLKRVYEEKNTIFPEAVKILRRKNGFWLSEDFEK